MSDQENAIWDVAVIGGGAAGMMAAASAAAQGARVILIEKNDSLGKKLLITGGGRCNVANAEFDTKRLLAKYGDAGKFLASPYARFAAKESIDFFESRGMPTKVENDNRAFPVSNKAGSVWDALVESLRAGNVTVRSETLVLKLETADKKISGVKIAKGTIRAQSYILATGGLSHPETGSTGDGFKWLKEIGHTIVTPRAALVPIATKEDWVARCAGTVLPDAKITVFQNEQKQSTTFGKVLFTHVGLSGPGILNASALIGELLEYDAVRIELDTQKDLDYGQLNLKLQELFALHHRKKVRNSLSEILPAALVPIVLAHANADPELACNSVSREARLALVQALKHMALNVKNLLGMEKAVIASGGVSLDEIHFKTMQSKLYENLYIVGDLLDVNRPSGGYSLQLCWTTGYVAGLSAFAHTSKIA